MLVGTKWSSCFKEEAVISCDKCPDEWSQTRTEKRPLGLVMWGTVILKSGTLWGEKSVWSELKRDSEEGIRDGELFREVLLLKKSRKMPQ